MYSTSQTKERKLRNHLASCSNLPSMYAENMFRHTKSKGPTRKRSVGSRNMEWYVSVQTTHSASSSGSNLPIDSPPRATIDTIKTRTDYFRVSIVSYPRRLSTIRIISNRKQKSNAHKRNSLRIIVSAVHQGAEQMAVAERGFHIDHQDTEL